MVLVMVVVVAMILTSLLGYITSQINYSKDRVERERAFQISEAGVYYYRWYLAHQIEGKTAQQISDFWEGNPAPVGVGIPSVAEFRDPEGTAIGEYRLEVTKPALGSTIVTVKSTGWTYKKPSVMRIVQVRFRRPSWSEDVVLANDNMRFGSGTTVNGKIHSNMGIRFDGVATNVVSSSLSSYDDPDHTESPTKLEFGVHTHITNGIIVDSYRPNEVPPHSVDSRTDVFQAGRQFPVAQMDFTSVISDISYMRSQAIATSTKFDNSGAGRMINLKTDGTFDMCTVNSYDIDSSGNSSSTHSNSITDYKGVVWGASSGNGSACVTTACCYQGSCSYIDAYHTNKGKCSSLTNYTIPNNGVIFVANNIWLEGTISNKKVSIVAAELTDESGYTGGAKNVYLGMNNLLYTNTKGSDIIGVIAQKDIEVIRDSLTNLTIDGALLAKDGRVGRDYYNGITRNMITVNGSIATNLRYGFAYVDGTGYITRNLNFDNNLLYYPPPYFPTGTEYSIDQWDELQ
jgi:hypothetical protein